MRWVSLLGVPNCVSLPAYAVWLVGRNPDTSMQHMQLPYAENLVAEFRKLFRHLVRHSSDSTLVHDHTS